MLHRRTRVRVTVSYARQLVLARSAVSADRSWVGGLLDGIYARTIDRTEGLDSGPQHRSTKSAKSTKMMLIRRLTPADAASFMEIRREALERELLAFGSSPGEDVAQSLEQVHGLLGQGEGAVFGAFDSALAGVVGVRRQTRQKERHKAEIWGMYLREEHRGRGLGRRLMEAAIAFAREQDGVRLLHLAVTLHVNGADLSERHMVLKL